MTSAPASRAAAKAANTASHAVAEIAWLMPDACSSRAARIIGSGRCSGRMRLAAEPARRYENSWPFAPCATKYTPVAASGSYVMPSVATPSRAQRSTNIRPKRSLPSRVTYATRAPRRAAAIAMFDVSPPKPCWYACGSAARAWLNSTSGSPTATMSVMVRRK